MEWPEAAPRKGAASFLLAEDTHGRAQAERNFVF